MIYLGYDPLNQGVFARHGDHRIFVPSNSGDRADEVLDGLAAVGTKLPRTMEIEQPEGGEFNLIVFENPYQYSVEFSEQAWKDLLEIGHALY